MKKFLIISIFIIALLVFGLAVWMQIYQKGLEISTQKEAYSEDEPIAIRIENRINREFCFSACYPYFVEEKTQGGWVRYEYEDCSKEDRVETCIEGKDIRHFETEFEIFKQGTYRLAVPACVSCSKDQPFKYDVWFYSNSFEII